MNGRNPTRFRAYQLGSKGASFSYFDGFYFTLIEARLTEYNKNNLEKEMYFCGVDRIHTLHITSWDKDHCTPSQLEEIIIRYNPLIIECPGYEPSTDTGKESMEIVESCKKFGIIVVYITPTYLKQLPYAEFMSQGNTFFGPVELDSENNNNNSTIKLFGSGDFNVLSLGDVESPEISERLIMQQILSGEVDIMVLAHHGADNGFTTDNLIKNTTPSIAVACSDFDNQFEHPRPNIRNILYDNGVRIFTTKTGDVLIKSSNDNFGVYDVINYQSDNEKISSLGSAYSKKALTSVKHALTRMAVRGESWRL